jgi:dolichol-phosphate mannosyltransferase
LLSYELVVINDGSCDNTLQVLRKQEKSDPHIRIISYPSNKGKGYAIKTGVLQSSGKIIIFVDGDLDISPSVIKDYVKELKTCDLVIASKRHPLSKVKAPISRKILSRMFNLFVRIAVNIKTKDTQAGLKAGNGDILRMIFKVILVKRYAFDVELLAIATDLRLNIKEMPVEISLGSRFKAREIAKMFLDVAAISYRYRIKRWYQKQLESTGNSNLINQDSSILKANKQKNSIVG